MLSKYKSRSNAFKHFIDDWVLFIRFTIKYRKSLKLVSFNYYKCQRKNSDIVVSFSRFQLDAANSLTATPISILCFLVYISDFHSTDKSEVRRN